MMHPRYFFVKLLMAALTVGSFWAPAAKAALVLYNFEAAAPNHLDPTSVESGVTATSVSPNTLTTLGDNPGFVRSTNNPPNNTASLAITFANIDDTSAPTGGDPATDNITFTIEAVGGLALNLDSLTFRSALNSEELSTRGLILTVQYDDLSDGAGFQLLTLNNTGIIFDDAAVTRSVDLSGAAFDNLTAGITFRINFSETGGPDSAKSGRIDFITLNGTVVPEPSALLLVLGTLPLLGLRRRHR